MSYNAKEDRTFRINGSLSITGKIAVFVKAISISVDAGVLQRDSIGTGESVFTQNGDVIGTFSFSLRNTTDLYDPAATPTLDETISFWNTAIADFDPAIVNFIETLNAPKGTGDLFARIRFDGRIMKPAVITTVDDALQDATVEGEITNYISALREAS